MEKENKAEWESVAVTLRTPGVKAGQMWKVHGHILEAQRVKTGPHSVDSATLNGGTMCKKNCVIRCSAEGRQRNGTVGDVSVRGRRKRVYLWRICEDEINRNKDNRDRCVMVCAKTGLYSENTISALTRNSICVPQLDVVLGACVVKVSCERCRL
jgi:hypothetical protein